MKSESASPAVEVCPECQAAERLAWAVFSEAGEKRGGPTSMPTKCEKHRDPPAPEQKPEFPSNAAVCVHCEPSFTPSGPDDYCYCVCHRPAATAPAAPAAPQCTAKAKRTGERCQSRATYTAGPLALCDDHLESDVSPDSCLACEMPVSQPYTYCDECTEDLQALAATPAPAAEAASPPERLHEQIEDAIYDLDQAIWALAHDPSHDGWAERVEEAKHDLRAAIRCHSASRLAQEQARLNAEKAVEKIAEHFELMGKHLSQVSREAIASIILSAGVAAPQGDTAKEVE